MSRLGPSWWPGSWEAELQTEVVRVYTCLAGVDEACGFYASHFRYIAERIAGFRQYNKSNKVFFSVFKCGYCSVAKSCLDYLRLHRLQHPGFPVHHQLLELVQTDVHWVSDAIQLSHPLLPPSPLAFNLSQHQGLFQWVISLHLVAKVLELQLQHRSF